MEHLPLDIIGLIIGTTGGLKLGFTCKKYYHKFRQIRDNVGFMYYDHGFQNIRVVNNKVLYMHKVRNSRHVYFYNTKHKSQFIAIKTLFYDGIEYNYTNTFYAFRFRYDSIMTIGLFIDNKWLLIGPLKNRIYKIEKWMYNGLEMREINVVIEIGKIIIDINKDCPELKAEYSADIARYLPEMYENIICRNSRCVNIAPFLGQVIKEVLKVVVPGS